MGESSRAVWAGTYDQVSRVEFGVRAAPYRRQTTVLSLVMIALLVWIWVLPDSSELWLPLMVAVLALGGLSFWFTAQTVSKRIVLLVDADGIRAGRNRLSWQQIGTIGVPRRNRLTVTPKDPQLRQLTITPSAVADLTALAGWLEDVLAQHRSRSESDAETR
ncbi:hypothetical protein HPO96_28075 [Kribbella sandramycini]|nr:hypothetical protein [Kribbella sandramycini]NOL44111.1 hypothetical protein [Kribbella sandramycini]